MRYLKFVIIYHHHKKKKRYTKNTKKICLCMCTVVLRLRVSIILIVCRIFICQHHIKNPPKNPKRYSKSTTTKVYVCKCLYFVIYINYYILLYLLLLRTVSVSIWPICQLLYFECSLLWSVEVYYVQAKMTMLGRKQIKDVTLNALLLTGERESSATATNG